jgi:hypothetical protein
MTLPFDRKENLATAYLIPCSQRYPKKPTDVAEADGVWRLE